MVKTGIDVSMFAAGIGGIALGVGAAGLGLFTDIGFRIAIIPFTGWVLVGVGGVVVLIGVVIALMSFGQKKCSACSASLEAGMCAFHPTAERDVMTAIQSNSIAALISAPMGSHADPNVQLSLDYCGKCRQVGLLSVDRFSPSREQVVTAQLVTGPFVNALAELVEARQNAHEERYAAA